MWVKWDDLQATQEQPEQSVSTVVNYDSDSTTACDLEEVMNLGYESNMFYVTCLNNKLLYSIFNPDIHLKIKLYHCNNHLLKGYCCRMMMT